MSVSAGLLKWNRERRRARRARVTREVVDATGGVVQDGPFTGLRYPAAAVAGSTLAPKLLGTYEREIDPWIEAAVARAPARIVNLGAGEGYYAVGLALRAPRAMVEAYETDPGARELCRAMAEANGVAARVAIEGTCGVDELRASVEAPALVICDVEGAEVDLLDPERVPGLRRCEIIVEIHGRRVGREIRGRFRDTHAVEHTRFRRGSRRSAAIDDMSRGDAAIAVDERRRVGLEWLRLLPQGSPS